MDIKTFNAEIEVATQETFDLDESNVPAELQGFELSGNNINKDEYNYSGINRGKKKRKNRKRKRDQKAAPVETPKEEVVQEEEDEVPVEERDIFVMKRWANVLTEMEIEIPK